MTRLTFITTAAFSTVLGVTVGYRIGEDVGRAEGKEQGRNAEVLRQRLQQQGKEKRR